MKLLLIGSTVAISLGLGAISAEGVTAPSRTSAAKAPSGKKAVRRSSAKAAQPHQGYRCSGPSAADGKSPPTGAAVVKSFTLTRIARPTPTSAVLRVDATVAAPKGAEIAYNYSQVGGTLIGQGQPRATWTLEEAGTWTITLEVYNRTSGCETFTSATYTIAQPRRKPTTTSRTMTPAKPQWEIDYEQRMAAYEQELAKQRQAVADYERQQAEVAARREELRLRAENSQAQWRRAVALCRAGDYSQCSGAAPR
jgi:hypothetical protein